MHRKVTKVLTIKKKKKKRKATRITELLTAIL